MHALTAVVGLLLLIVVFPDMISTVVVARHTQGLPRLTRLFYEATWAPYAAVARFVRSERARERYLGVYGPASLLMLLGLWAVVVIVAFAMLQWSAGLTLHRAPLSFASDLYFSAASSFTLVSTEPQNLPSKYLMVLEAGAGLGFLGLVIGYLPVLYQSFSGRELRILLLDARAGSPPSAAELLLRRGSNPEKLEERLADWEEWALDLLQTHLSYPMLAYYRSQHPNQSWLAALTVVVDVSALVTVTSDGDLKRQAQFTFAAGRHALAHSASMFRLAPRPSRENRLTVEDGGRLWSALSAGLAPAKLDRIPTEELSDLREMYEPCANALSAYFLMPLPPWLQTDGRSENWQMTSWGS